MTFEQYMQWKKARCALPDNEDVAQAISSLIERPEAVKEINDALCELECCASNVYNRDSFRALFTAIHDAADKLEKKHWLTAYELETVVTISNIAGHLEKDERIVISDDTSLTDTALKLLNEWEELSRIELEELTPDVPLTDFFSWVEKRLVEIYCI